ncbi:hypothetical protein ACOMHN_041741 [Nucella lapillus]
MGITHGVSNSTYLLGDASQQQHTAGLRRGKSSSTDRKPPGRSKAQLWGGTQITTNSGAKKDERHDHAYTMTGGPIRLQYRARKDWVREKAKNSGDRTAAGRKGVRLALAVRPLAAHGAQQPVTMALRPEAAADKAPDEREIPVLQAV